MDWFIISKRCLIGWIRYIFLHPEHKLTQDVEFEVQNLLKKLVLLSLSIKIPRGYQMLYFGEAAYTQNTK